MPRETFAMARPLLPPAASMLLVVSAAIFSLIASVTYLGGAVAELAVTAPQDAASSGPNFIASIEPLPAGSISAIVPLSAPAKGEPVAAATPPVAAVTEATAAVVDIETAVAATAAVEQVAAPVDPQRPRMIATSGVNVRDRPSSKSIVIGTLRGGASVEVLGNNRGWIHVSDGSRTGWVYERYLRPAN